MRPEIGLVDELAAGADPVCSVETLLMRARELRRELEEAEAELVIHRRLAAVLADYIAGRLELFQFEIAAEHLLNDLNT